MKNRGFKKTDEFRQFKTKIFFRTILLVVIAAGGIYLLYSFILKGNCEKNLNCNLSAADNIMIRCDADKIQRVFDNILRNAVLYSFEGTDIDIVITEEKETVVVTFTNHGDTIPEEKLERIFEQFYRLDAARNTGGGGAGLGLAIAKQIIELHGGTIMAGSEGDMIEFRVVLPVTGSAQA